MALNSFNAYHSYLRAIEPLDEPERGRLFTALLHYSVTGEEPPLPGNERFLFPMMRDQMDRDRQAYADKCARNRRNIEKRWHTEEYEADADAEPKPADTAHTKDRDRNKDTDKDSNKDRDTDRDKDKDSPPARLPHGDYGWVRLSPREYERLLRDLGETELRRCIDYVDEAAQSTGNKNRWKDWNLVLRRCSRNRWGLEREKAAPQNDRYGWIGEVAL